MKKVIVLIWRIASWKDYAGDFLAKNLQAKHLGISSGLRIIAKQRNISEDRENLIQIWREVTQKYGDGYLAEVLLQDCEDNKIIISGARQLGQLEYLWKESNSLFIAIKSDAEIRYKRMKKRWKTWENISFEKFLSLERDEESTVQNVWKCMDRCSIVIENNWTLEEFENKLRGINFNF